jgi:hypothetical protein
LWYKWVVAIDYEGKRMQYLGYSGTEEGGKGVLRTAEQAIKAAELVESVSSKPADSVARWNAIAAATWKNITVERKAEIKLEHEKAKKARDVSEINNSQSTSESGPTIPS